MYKKLIFKYLNIYYTPILIYYREMSNIKDPQYLPDIAIKFNDIFHGEITKAENLFKTQIDQIVKRIANFPNDKNYYVSLIKIRLNTEVSNESGILGDFKYFVIHGVHEEFNERAELLNLIKDKKILECIMDKPFFRTGLSYPKSTIDFGEIQYRLPIENHDVGKWANIRVLLRISKTNSFIEFFLEKKDPNKKCNLI